MTEDERLLLMAVAQVLRESLDTSRKHRVLIQELTRKVVGHASTTAA